MVGDSLENVASLQGCHFQQRDSVQTLGKIRQTFPRKTGCWKTTVSVCQGGLRAGSHLCSASANIVPSSGLNTKQLSNQMLELTKVINELRDVLIQQVGAQRAAPFLPASALQLRLSDCPRSRRRRFSETPSPSARPAVRSAHSRSRSRSWA